MLAIPLSSSLGSLLTVGVNSCFTYHHIGHGEVPFENELSTNSTRNRSRTGMHAHSTMSAHLEPPFTCSLEKSFIKPASVKCHRQNTSATHDDGRDTECG